MIRNEMSDSLFHLRTAENVFGDSEFRQLGTGKIALICSD